jgi:hypothetical protein
VQKMTMSPPIHCRLLVFFLKCRRWQWIGRLIAHCHLLGFVSSVSSLAASPLNASLQYIHIHGDVTTPFLSHHTLTAISIIVAQNPHLIQSCKYFQRLSYNFIFYQGDSILLLQF